jgi:nitrate/nitrite-specific signal transduction histidine kinase
LVTTFDADNNNYVAPLNWAVIVHQPEVEALADVVELQRTTTLVGVIAVLAAALVGFLIAQWLSTPIVRLTHMATRVQQGDLAVRTAVTTKDEMGTLAVAFNAMTQQLSTFIETLEQRAADRTRALTASAEVSRRLSTILDYSQLVTEVVEIMRAAFGYYHVQIYTFDEAQAHLVLAGGTGESGRMMIERGHKLPTGRGLVGRAAETNQVVLVPDTSADAGWLPNPLLPETRSELALPIALGREVLGVLDVQQNQADSFNADEVALLQSVANQIAAALSNARSFTRAQQQAHREASLLSITQKIQAATTPESVLQIATQELGQALQARRATAHIRLKPTEPKPTP